LAGLAGGAALSLAGCAEVPPQRIASGHPKEYFPSSIWGPASPRVVAEGEPVPRGGGMYMVGKPYTIAGKTYYPSEKRYAAIGLASWYGDAFHGRRTANGEIYDRDAISAAHPTMPLPSYARVTNLRNHYSMIVRVNDRGPFTGGRIMDASRKTAELLEFSRVGTTPVKVEYIGAAELSGSDDLALLATLRSDRAASFASISGRDRAAPSRLAGNEARPVAVAMDSEDSGLEPAVSVNRKRPGPGFAPLPPRRPADLGLRLRGHSSPLAMR
jgi:rare lipoprotein A